MKQVNHWKQGAPRRMTRQAAELRTYVRRCFHPPSQCSTCPVIHPAPDEQRKATSALTSSGVPMRPSGAASRIRPARSASIHPVWVGPGLIAFTVIPLSARSPAIATVAHSMALFGRRVRDFSLSWGASLRKFDYSPSPGVARSARSTAAHIMRVPAHVYGEVASSSSSVSSSSPPLVGVSLGR